MLKKTQLEQEIGKLRDGRDDLERREAVLSNRLNDAKKERSQQVKCCRETRRGEQRSQETIRNREVRFQNSHCSKRKDRTFYGKVEEEMRGEGEVIRGGIDRRAHFE